MIENELGKGKLMLVTFTDESGKEFPQWIKEQKCLKYNLTLGNTYNCHWVGEHVLLINNNGKQVTGLYIYGFEKISDIRENKLKDLGI